MSQKRRKLRNIQMARSPKDGRTISVKPTEAMRAWVQARSEEQGITMSELARRAVDLARDLQDKLGADWHEVERRAGVAGQATGIVLANLIRAALEQERKAKK